MLPRRNDLVRAKNCLTLPEELMASVDSLDSTDPGGRVWVRDAYDRTVRIRMRGGMVEVLEC